MQTLVHTRTHQHTNAHALTCRNTHKFCGNKLSDLSVLQFHLDLLQHGVLKANKPVGLPLNIKLLPQELKNLGYATHIIGK